ncbi:MAG: hypothetical protein QW076_03250 [Candidatus Anstonellales archaeon]
MPTERVLNSKANKGQNNQNKFELYYCEALFFNFLKEIPSYYSNKIIPFPVVYSWFSFRKINKQVAKNIIKIWQDLGFCSWIPYHGVKVNEKNKAGGV